MFGKKKEPERANVCAVIPAAGASIRMGENKLMLDFGGAPVLAHTIAAFEACEVIGDIVLVCREEDIMPYGILCENYAFRKVRAIVRGGETRTHSVLEGIRATPEGTAVVAIHDGARPLVSEAVIREAVEAAFVYGGAAPVVAMKDSVKLIADGDIVRDVPRDTIAAVQTPQCFNRDQIEQALESALADGVKLTDDCAAFEHIGLRVFATHGDYQNIKLTTPEDIAIGLAFLEDRK